MEARSVMIAVALAGVLFTGYALLASLIKPEDSPLSEYVRSSQGESHPDPHDAIHDLAYFAVFGRTDGGSFPRTPYVVEGMLRLASALEMLAQRDAFDSSDPLSPRNIRGAADELRAAARAEDPAIARGALTLAAAATTELQQRWYPHLSVATANLAGAAARIQPDRNLAEQHDAFAAYFDAISDALMPMILLRR